MVAAPAPHGPVVDQGAGVPLAGPDVGEGQAGPDVGEHEVLPHLLGVVAVAGGVLVPGLAVLAAPPALHLVQCADDACVVAADVYRDDS